MNENYTPPATAIVHEVTVDLLKRDFVPETIHVVQYDYTIPIVAVKFRTGLTTYKIPTGYNVRVRMGKPDHKQVYNDALGISSDRLTAYVAISQQMTASYGLGEMLIEISNASSIVGTSKILVSIDRNPASYPVMKSSDEYKSLEATIEETKKSADAAKASQTAAKTSETNAKNSADAAKASQTAAKTSETNAKNSETAAKNSQTAAKASQDAAADSASAAAASQTAAKGSQDAAATSATNAKNSADAAKASETAAAASQAAAKTSETNAKNSETAAKNSQTAAASSQTAAANSAKLSESWAIGGTNSRDGEDTNNSKYYANQSKSSQTAAATSATNAKNSETAATASQDAAATSATNAENWSNTSKSWAIGEGAASTHPNEKTDNSKYYANQAAASAKVVSDNQAAIQDIHDNLDAVKSAADNALAAESAAEDAATSAEVAQEAADRAQSIAQGQLGYYETPENLRAAYPTGQNGYWAIVGTTDTIWIWDETDKRWEDSGNKTDLSQYYTKTETDAEIDKVQTALSQAKQDKLTGTTGQLVGFDANGTAEVQGYHVNENMLSNWYLGDPVNEKGLTSYTIVNDLTGYSGTHMTLTIKDGYLNCLSDKSSTHKRIGNKGYCQLKAGETYIGSALIKVNEVGGRPVLRVTNITGVFITGAQETPLAAVTNDYELYSAKVTPSQDVQGFAVEILVPNNTNSYIDADVLAFKMERGSTQTLAHKENGKWVLNAPPPNKEAEKVRCGLKVDSTYIPVTSTNKNVLTTTSGTAFFDVKTGAGIGYDSEDLAVMQVDSGIDSFQLTTTGGKLAFRQNDAGAANGSWPANFTKVMSQGDTAAAASKLVTARSLKTKLDSTAAVTFDGSAAQDAIPVTGTLPIANGGTGATTAANARTNLGITAANLGLGNVNNTADANKTVAAAGKLTTARSLGVNLARTAASTFDGSANQLEIPVKGTLPVANGGTGVTSIAGLRDSIDASYPIGKGNILTMHFVSGDARSVGTSYDMNLVENIKALLSKMGLRQEAGTYPGTITLASTNAYGDGSALANSLPNAGMSSVSIIPTNYAADRGFILLHGSGTNNTYIGDIYNGTQGAWHKIYTDADLAAIISAVTSKFLQQHGQFQQHLTASTYPGWARFTVRFPKAYASLPIVTIGPTYYSVENVTVENVTTTGFTALQYMPSAPASDIVHDYYWFSFGIIS